MTSEAARKLDVMGLSFEAIGGLTCDMCPVKADCDKSVYDGCTELLEVMDREHR